MKSRGKQLMDFVEKEDLIGINVVNWAWLDKAEAKLNQFLEKQSDPRLKDAKDEVESLRMELRETRKTLEKAEEEANHLEAVLSRHHDGSVED